MSPAYLLNLPTTTKLTPTRAPESFRSVANNVLFSGVVSRMMDVVVDDPDLTKDVIRLLGQELKTVRRQLHEAQRSLSARPDTDVTASNDAAELLQAENMALKERISALEHQLVAYEDVKSVKLEPSSTIKVEDLHYGESESEGATHAKLEKTDKYERLKQAHQELTETLAARETKLQEATTVRECALRELQALQKQSVKTSPCCHESIQTDPDSLFAFADLRPFARAEVVTFHESGGQQPFGTYASTAAVEAQERATAAEAQVAALKDEIEAVQLENAELRQQEIRSNSMSRYNGSIARQSELHQRKWDSEVCALLTEEEADQEKCIAMIMNLQEKLATQIEDLEKRKALKSRQHATPDAASDGNSAESSKGASGIAQAGKPMAVDVIQICHHRESEGNYYNRRAVVRSLPRPLSPFCPNSLVFPSSMDEAAIHSFLKDYCQKRNLDGAILSGVQSFMNSSHGFIMVPMNGANNPPKDGDINAKARLSYDSAEGRTPEVFLWRPNTRKTCYLGKIDCFKMPPLTIEEVEDLKPTEWSILLKMMQGSFELPQIEAVKNDRAAGCQAGKIIIYCLGLQRISFDREFCNGLQKEIAALHEDSTNKRKHEENIGNQSTTGNQTKKAKLKRRH